MAMQSGFIKRIRDIMRMDAGINGDAQRIEQILDPMDTIREYQERRTTLNAEIDKVLAELEALLPGGVSE